LKRCRNMRRQLTVICPREVIRIGRNPMQMIKPTAVIGRIRLLLLCEVL